MRSRPLRNVTREPSAEVARVANGFSRPCQSWLGLEVVAARREVVERRGWNVPCRLSPHVPSSCQLGHPERVAVELEAHAPRHGVVFAVGDRDRHHAAVTEADVDEPALAVEVDDERAVIERRPQPSAPNTWHDT